ncbi:PREDICTED: tartrate-resistant acid phosphatase type 5-like isoform X2 [Amphimedon queenslandica]|uniref:Tartrate-resistant acid phosphatase type 5 n=1 Tax=Amphimedon queenslandica TaxID=400682 RepID=A0A1X7V516_AMPQE|nr:PREDICTED: tartrate-resistant acid phosphatase type 5-like isoform X2 [Amphimedon queenslandica]|eukprot:XP_019850708.1 PREDICTED: tartrate-resistant acid phosphatase type 5-like isoform X2 [Amphimedon queenslandica]
MAATTPRPCVVSILFFLSTFLAFANSVVDVSGNSLNFLVIGDWGGMSDEPYYTVGQSKVASVMGEKAEKIDSQFTLAVGDNFYEDGVKDVDDPRFNETFEEVFTAPSLQKRWYAICGNHDYNGNASAQVAYTQKSARWYMPSFYYTEIFNLSSSNITIQFVFIDTVILCGLSHPKLRHLPPSGPQSSDLADDQWAWIESTLQQSTADWLIVSGHYPVWSVAEHGPTDELVKNLRPLLIKYNVTAYFCGHDHDIQHIKEDGSSVNYFVSGAGHLIDSSTEHEDKVPKGSLKYRYGTSSSSSDGAYNTVTITAQSMVVNFFNVKGEMIYTSTLDKTR